MAIKFLRNLSQKFINQNDNIQEGAQAEKEGLLELTMKDEDLVLQINRDLANSLPQYQQMRAIMEENEKYYLGEQYPQGAFDWELPTAENLLYMATETVISIITAKRREPIVLAAQNTDESKDLAEKNQQFLTWKWNDEDMSIKFEDWVRHGYLNRIGIFKIRFDINKDDFEIKVIRPQRIIIDKDATDEYDAKFIIELKQDSLSDLMEMFPSAKTELTQKYGEKLGTQISYLEYWTNEFVVWKVEDLILDKKKNPNWNWDEKDRKENLKELRKRWIEKTKNEKLENILLNYFNEPRKPYVILSLKSLGNTIYGDTSDFDQGKVIQDIINRRKRQIDKNAVRALGREVISGSFISKEEAKKLLSNPNAPFWLKSGNVNEALGHISPQPISPVVFDDLNESKMALDNVMGTHGTTRGERGPQETATGRNILREGDLGRIDLLVRRIDKKLELLYSWIMQMVKVYYAEPQFVKLLGLEGATTYLDYSNNDVEDGLEIIVKSELTVDKASQRQNAQTLLQMGLIDPITYYEKTDETKPKEKARKLVFYNTDPKMYIQQFAVDENTEGTENDPLMQAKRENQQLANNEPVPPFQGVDPAHLQEHGKFAQSKELKNKEVDVQNNFLAHMQGEVEILKQMSQSMQSGGQQGAGQPQ